MRNTKIYVNELKLDVVVLLQMLIYLAKGYIIEGSLGFGMGSAGSMKFQPCVEGRIKL